MPSTTKAPSKTGRKARTSLNEQERVALDRYFVNGFVKDEALRHAGYAVPNKRSRFWTRPLIMEEIEKRMRQLTRKANVSPEMVLEELRAIAFARFGDMVKVSKDGSAYIDFTGLTADQRAAIAEMTVEEYQDGKGDNARAVKRTKLKFHSKEAALTQLGRYFKLFTEKIELSGTVGLNERISRGRDRMNEEHKGEEDEGSAEDNGG